MTLIKRKNGPNSQSYRVAWSANKSWVTIGPCKNYSDHEAHQCHQMIMSLVATKRVGQSFDSKQIEFLASVDNKLRAQLEREGLVRERAAQRSRVAFQLANIVSEYRSTRQDEYATAKVLKIAFINFLKCFGDTKDIREITINHAKNYPDWLKSHGRTTGAGKLADTTIAKRVDCVKSLFIWAVNEEILPRNVFGRNVKTSRKPMAERTHLVTLAESELLFESQDNLQNLALAVLARFMGVRPVADLVWLRRKDINFADGDCSKAELTLDSVKTNGRKCPLFSDAVYIILKLLCDRVPDPDGFLIHGEVWDRIRTHDDETDTSSLSLSTEFRKRYVQVHGKDLWPKPFVNTRSTVITELVKVYGYDQHSVGIWLGNTPMIQNQHYLQMMDDDHRDAMRNWPNHKKGSEKGSRRIGTHLSAMIFRALYQVCPELVSAAEKHALGITKIGLNSMFESAESTLANSSSLRKRGGLSSRGGTRTRTSVRTQDFKS